MAQFVGSDSAHSCHVPPATSSWWKLLSAAVEQVAVVVPQSLDTPCVEPLVTAK